MLDGPDDVQRDLTQGLSVWRDGFQKFCAFFDGVERYLTPASVELMELGEIQLMFLGVKPATLDNSVANRFGEELERYGFKIAGPFLYDPKQVEALIAANRHEFGDVKAGELMQDISRAKEEALGSAAYELVEYQKVGLICGYPASAVERSGALFRCLTQIHNANPHALRSVVQELQKKSDKVPMGAVMSVLRERRTEFFPQDFVIDPIPEHIDINDTVVVWGNMWNRFGDTSVESGGRVELIQRAMSESGMADFLRERLLNNTEDPFYSDFYLVNA